MKLSPKDTLRPSKPPNNVTCSRIKKELVQDLREKVATNYDPATRRYIQSMATGYGIGFGKMAGLLLKELRLDDQAAESGT